MTKNASTDDSGSINPTNYDGFVMRLTPLGFVQWVSYLSAKQGIDEYVGNVAQFISGAGPGVLATFHTSNPTATSRTSAIAKLTYDEGKLIWAK